MTNRMLPVFLLALWLAAVIMLFSAAVYGDYDIFVDAVRKGEIRHEFDRLAKRASTEAEQVGSALLQRLKKEGHKGEKELARLTSGSNKTRESAAVPTARNGTLEANAFTPTGSSFTARLRFSPSAPGYKWFTLQKPQRLVIDFSGQWEQQVPRIQSFDTGPVRKVVYGIHPGYLRMVLHFPSPPGKNGPTAPDIERTNQGVVIRVTGETKGAS